jgi:hypothetical protein
MPPLTKILGIGILTLASLTGCAKRHHIDGDLVKYNALLSTPMIIQSDSERAAYQKSMKWNSLPLTGKDISIIYVYKKDYMLPFSLLSRDNPKDTAEFNKAIKKFEYCQGVIKSRKNSKK